MVSCRSGQNFPYWPGGSGAGAASPAGKTPGRSFQQAVGEGACVCVPVSPKGLRAQSSSFHAGRMCGARDKTQLILQ